MRLALIGDIHLYRLAVWPWLLFGKRILGQTNLWLNRRHRFDRSLLAPVVERVASIEPDMLLFSGDVTSTALSGEFADAVDSLDSITSRITTVMVPGNHDRYTFSSLRNRSFERAFGELAVPLPHFRQLSGRWHLLALDTVVPRIVSSRGCVKSAQLQQARTLIADLTDRDGLVVLCHYDMRRPPDVSPAKWQHQLVGAGQFEKLLADCPARTIVLHGHVHEPWCWHRQDGPLRGAVNICAGAPCLRRAEHPHGQGFWQIDLPPDTHEQAKIVQHVPRSMTMALMGIASSSSSR